MPRASICTFGRGGNLNRSDDLGDVLVVERGGVGFAVVLDTDDVAADVGILHVPDPDDEGGGPIMVDVIVVFVDTAVVVVGVNDKDRDDGERCNGVVGWLIC